MSEHEEKRRAQRNRTITLSKDEITYYLNKCVTSDGLTNKLTGSPCAGHITDTVIFSDVFDVFGRLPDSFVDLLIADPPYNLNKSYADTNFKKMNQNEYCAFTEKWILGIKRLLKKSASAYVCCDWQSSMMIGPILQEHFYIQNRITWQREKGRGAQNNWKNSMEDIWFVSVSAKDYTFNVDDVKLRRRVLAPYTADGKPKDWVKSSGGNFRDTYPSNFWDDISVPYWSMPENTDHPAQKPEKLIAKIILASSNPGEIVFDPFLGSGSSAVTAKKLGRHYVGIEREPLYCALAQKRLETAENDKKIQGYSDGVFWERNTAALHKTMRKNHAPPDNEEN
ncbi:MAG: site-specific DNA-methyltransferase [Oscillospiraceae bacterium]|nr:site-specific DNA-methyltransferase [Oscillospiraceae bacterium]